MSSREDVIPDQIYDSNTKMMYTKGRFFGKGGFAKCYEITDTKGMVFAGKIVSKNLMQKQNQRDKMTQEIAIHQSLKHKHVVGFNGFFEDQYNIYVVLELCRKRSMMELHKRRKILTEPETRFYMKQLVSGIDYLHSNNIIHRDLKLGNIFLNDDLHVKIGDFGLAAKIVFDGERKKTLCGTPNYIAPEILTKKGHSFEVDIWSLGCIMYTLLIGRPPFETSSLRETYSKIKKGDYSISNGISDISKHMIMLMLQQDPSKRPKIRAIGAHDFFKGYTPQALPSSCLTMAPRYDHVESLQRRPLIEMNGGAASAAVSPAKPNQSVAASGMSKHRGNHDFDAKENITELRKMLTEVLLSKPARPNQNFGDEMSDPAAQPLVWISKWVDYSDKYGFGYQICDDSVGVMFNDSTKLILLPNTINVQYVDKNGDETYMTVDEFPKSLEKKMKLLSYFSRYMKEHLIKAGASQVRALPDTLSRIPHLHQWCRSTSGVLMQLNNGTIQINFIDHSKIIMCPLMAAISYLDHDRSFRTFRFDSIKANGCSTNLHDKIRYAYDKLSGMLNDNQF